ncbi:hypothetical protein SD81_016200, partial [Tolypothrix campylonemoides VB511288]
MDSWYTHAFDGRIAVHDVGRYRYTVLVLPDDLAATLPFDGAPRLRIRGELDDVPLTGAWQPVRGRWFLMLSKATLRFRIDDAARVDVPDALQALLDAEPDAAAAWAALTPGKRRALAVSVATARTPATVARRVDAARGALRTGKIG